MAGTGRQWDRRAWRIGGSVVAALVLVGASVQSVVALAHDEETVVTVVDDPVRVLDVDNPTGSVRVVGTDAATVTVTAHVDHGLARTDHDVAVDGDRVVVRDDCPAVLSSFCEVDLVIEVPRDLELALVARDGVTVTGTTGVVTVEVEHGAVEVDAANGPVALRSTHGDVVARLSGVDDVRATSDHGDVELVLASPPRSVEADSDHGDVSVVVPDAPEAYAVAATADHGDTTVAVRTDPASPRRIDASSDHGDVRVTARG